MNTPNGGSNNNVGKLYEIERHLKRLRCCLAGGGSEECGCDCAALNINVDGLAEAIAEAFADLDLNVDIGTICDKEFLCDADCVTVKCRECYNPNTGDITSTTHTLLDGIPYTGDINALNADCSNCGEEKEECILIPATPQQCPTIPAETPKEECLLIPANTCK